MDKSTITHELTMLYLSNKDFESPSELASAYIETNKVIAEAFPVKQPTYNQNIKGDI